MRLVDLEATKLHDEAIAKARELPEAQQDLAAEVLLSVVDQGEPLYRLTPEQGREVKRIQKDLREGKAPLASDEQVEALEEMRPVRLRYSEDARRVSWCPGPAALDDGPQTRT